MLEGPDASPAGGPLAVCAGGWGVGRGLLSGM